ncbi:MarR family winged helix-turn-helix transcriptional regulator [Mumia zhuanghuii]|uniref:MarR family transcriptional regulator n=1 Tax=Mumia zhuanghuii TaxID=2585211 RepID=A0A5C4MST7_9ACTN|nr:MarR family transcriptional regulator [Mumia zhuanghuii]TNC43593.1 MarR family transcriptional regulator [Mumia zhuanghuii]TNC48626.1 MarR family transcriptional regulator [Mumia zhuanghuii]
MTTHTDDLRDYPTALIARQPIGAWTGDAYRRVVGAIREALATEDLTQPHWWTLNHAAGDPGRWTRATLTERLRPYEDLGIDFDDVYDDLVARGWLREDDGTMTLTEAGAAGLERARERNARVHQQTVAGISDEDYVTMINVLRRVVANLGGDGNLPD